MQVSSIVELTKLGVFLMPTIQNQQHYHWVVAFASTFCGVLVFAIVGLTLANGVGYQDFESFSRYQDIELYNAALVEAARTLRLIYPLDTLYIFGYLIMTFAMVQISKESTFCGVLALIAALMTGGLDFIENNHILLMAQNAEIGHMNSPAQVSFGAVVTQTKFNFGLLLTLCISFLIPADTKAGIAARWLARLLVLCAPVALLTPPTTLLYIAMNIILAGLIAFTYGMRQSSTPNLSLSSSNSG